MTNRFVAYVFSFLLISLSPIVSFAAKSLTFGGDGVETSSQIHVYIDSSDPDPAQEYTNYVRYSVLVDDCDATIGGTKIDRVVVFTDYVGEEKYDLTSPVLYPKTVWRHQTSPGKTEQVEISLPMPVGKNLNVEDINFHLLTLKRRCLNPTVATCNDLVTVTQGRFTGKDLKSLKPIQIRQLLKDKK